MQDMPSQERLYTRLAQITELFPTALVSSRSEHWLRSCESGSLVSHWSQVRDTSCHASLYTRLASILKLSQTTLIASRSEQWLRSCRSGSSGSRRAQVRDSASLPRLCARPARFCTGYQTALASRRSGEALKSCELVGHVSHKLLDVNIGTCQGACQISTVARFHRGLTDQKEFWSATPTAN